VSLTIKPTKKARRPSTSRRGRPSARQERIEELIGIMVPWDPKERVSAFRAWLRGSLSLIHLHVLTTLETEGPLSMSRLAEALDVSVASATGIVGRMEERGLVDRRHGATDRRIVEVHVTEAGGQVFKSVDEMRRMHFGAVLGRLTDDELESLLVGLRATRAARMQMTAEAAAGEGDRP
jgi:DNA-binding MarR family transcriptional regulator